MDQRIRVMVTGVGGGGIGAQLLKALRLSDLDYYILAGDITPISKGLVEADAAFILPRADDPNYANTVLEHCKKHGAAALLPGSEPELLAISRHRQAFEDAGVFLPIQPAKVLEICSDKAATMSFLAAHGFSVPRTVSVRRDEDLEAIDFYPAVLKPATGSGGSAGVMIGQTPGEVQMFGRLMLLEYRGLVVQEYVGTPGNEYTAGVLTAMDGAFINSVAIRRNILSGLGNRVRVANRSGRDSLGPVLAISSGISQGELGRFTDVTAPSEAIAEALGAKGALNVQGRLVDGKWYVFEINPRFSGTTPMRAIMGFNEPDILLRRHLLGEKIAPRFQYRTGHLVRGLQEVLIDPETIKAQK